MARIRSRFDAWARRPWKQGDTAHATLFAAACLLIEEGYDEDQISTILLAGAGQVSDRRVTEREIDSAIRYAQFRDQSGRAGPRWPDFNPYLHAEVSKGFSVEDLRACSGPIPDSPESCLEALFPGDPLLCIGATAYAFETRHRSLWAGFLQAMPYLVPNPMSAIWGTTAEGKQSMHTLSNTSPRTHLVVEFDSGTLDEHAAMLRYLSKLRPLVLAVYSGGKSLHGWFRAPEAEEYQNAAFFGAAAALGADTRMWLKSQFTRVPGGTNRKTQKRQEILFFNPNNT
jgi:hypothetical protein